MGRSIDLYSYDYEKLVNKILQVCNTDNRELIEKVLTTCGNHVGDRYIILNQEFWEGYSCYYNVASVLEKMFKVEDVFGEVFCTFNDEETDKQELINVIEEYEIYEALGIDEPENEDDEDY